ncbi:adhesion G-protein coupled receptor G1 isoform X5 [Oreochromis niloticus]|uniref:adhesion G-protein coupled receptor G1 isoform X5 n=1 Tax=Oreochromis niloticus TaxID=8128 RepID=UPI00090504F2|nr:adhesion G-protein coupled receptor G1 isoform X5 [Oreochromis niloticus]
MWITLFLFKIICFSMSQAAGGNSFTTQKPLRCGDVLLHCTQSSLSWTRCYEEKIAKCELKTRIFGFSRQTVNSLLEGDLNPTSHHRVYITSSSFEGAATTVMASVINSTYFKLSPPQRSRLQFHRREGTVLRGLVLAVKAVNMTENGEIIRNLLQPIMLFFKHNNMLSEITDGTCVFWEESNSGTGYWSVKGCKTNKTGDEFICSCDHLSFFAVLVNPEISVTNLDAEKLSYITYIGSALSVIFTFISLIIFIWLQCWISSDFQSRRPLVSYITTVAFPLLVVLFNACMLGLVVCKMWKLRSDDKKMNFGSSSDWKEIKKEKRKRLWKDCLTVLGLSCVLGLPWGLASTTYVSLTGIYIFTILNSLQGVFIFLWSVGLARKS